MNSVSEFLFLDFCDSPVEALSIKKFPCDSCDYLATLKSDLRTHMNSVYEENKFPCELYDYLATLKSNLKRHIESIHESVS